MTARDEAARAMIKAPLAATMAQYLDAIPADVLARYAIERGGLRPVHVGGYEELWIYDIGPDAKVTDDELPEDTPLYRLVEP